MVASVETTEWLLEITGEGDEFIEPPADLQIRIRSRSKSLGFGGQGLLSLVVEVPWDEIAFELALHMLAAWLYDMFTKRSKKIFTKRSKKAATPAQDTQETQGVNIRVNGDVFIVADAAQLESILRARRPDDKK